jgi:hypothetical protein
MQNRYVGDVGDFAKYALLRRLAGTSKEQPTRLGIVWCLSPDESHNDDGRHVSYLRRLEFEGLDVELLAELRKIVDSGRRSITAIAKSKIFPRDTIFCDTTACLPRGVAAERNDRLVYRAHWLEHCLHLAAKCEIVFFDPDNGIEVASVPKHHPKSGKYIYWDELAPFWDRGHSLLIYHHLNRTKPAADQVAQLTLRLQNEFSSAMVKALVFRRGSCRVFWLVIADSALGRELECRANDFLSAGWAMHFRMFD